MFEAMAGARDLECREDPAWAVGTGQHEIVAGQETSVEEILVRARTKKSWLFIRLTPHRRAPGMNAATDRTSRLTGVALLVIASLGFSGKAVIIKLAYRYGVDAVTLLALRMLFSAPLFALIAWWTGQSEGVEPLTGGERSAVVALGLVGYYLASLFDFIGLQFITVALERLVLYLYPTIVMLLAAVFLGRRITPLDVLALGLSYGGIVLVFLHDLGVQGPGAVKGALWVLLSAVLYATYLLGSGRLVHRLGSLRLACLAGLVSCAAVVAHFLATRETTLLWTQPAPVLWLGSLMAVASTVLPVMLTFEGIRRIGASHASLVGAVGPVATIALGSAFLGEAITAIQLGGAALVLAGVLTVSFGPSQGTNAGRS